MQNDPPTNSEKDKKGETSKENWADDQKERGYYYDDAHGYEQFDPESEDETGEDNEPDSDDANDDSDD